MFPLQRCNELAIPLSNTLNHHPQHHKIPQDLILDDCDSLLLDFSHKKMAISHPPKLLFYTPSPDNNNNNNTNHGTSSSSNLNPIKDKKKMVHREIEKQRRQEMATLHASLRSLLPLRFIKGKRSLSDQMNEGVNYINHMKKNIKELSDKRDELKKLSNIPSQKSHVSCTFSIHKNNGTVGIEINNFKEEEVPLSKFLEQLVNEELEVFSCFTVQVNGRLIHSVQCKVIGSDSVDLSELRRKISNMNPSIRCSDD